MEPLNVSTTIERYKLNTRCPFPLRLTAAFLLSCSHALFTHASLDVGVQIIFTVVDGDFLSLFDVLERPNPDSTAGSKTFGVWPAGVVDITSRVGSGFTVNRALLIKLKQVLAGSSIGFFVGDDVASIFDNPFPLLNGSQCK